uniref:Uncharacterized protein n=1 Tax=viral metagenome TaxID=1070528 RepID=A0A6M3K4R4_9ZZZZ
MTQSNYEQLGISTPSYLKEGLCPLAVLKVEKFDQKFGNRINDIAIKVIYRPDGKSGYDYNFILSGDYKRGAAGQIVAAGGAFVVLSFFDALGVIAIDVNGDLESKSLDDCQAEFIKTDNPLIEEYKPNIYGYMYREKSKKDGRIYWRVYRRFLPITAKDSDMRKLVSMFEQDVRKGYVKPATREDMQEAASEVTVNVSESEEL